jgi:hypothetical protein
MVSGLGKRCVIGVYCLLIKRKKKKEKRKKKKEKKKKRISVFGEIISLWLSLPSLDLPDFKKSYPRPPCSMD